MKNKFKFSRFILLSLFILLLISLGSVCAADNDDLGSADNVFLDDGSSSSLISSSDDINSINNNADVDLISNDESDDVSQIYNNLYRENDYYVLEGDSFESIQYAIDSVEENSTIVLHGMDSDGKQSNFYGNGSQIVINKSITLNGKGITLDAKYLSRIFYITANNVTLTNLSLINANHRNNNSFDDSLSSGYPYDYYSLGTIGDNGGVIKWLGDDGCLQNTIFSNNLYAEFKKMDGTIISWEGKNGIIINSYFGINYLMSLSSFMLDPPLYSKIIDAPIYGDYEGDLYKNNTLIKNAIVNAESVWNRLNHKNLYHENDYYVLEGDSFEDIQQAINSVEENSYIKLRGINSDGSPSNFNGKGSEIVINKSVTLDGNGITLDARHMSRIFYITADNVSLINLNLINANHRDAWGYGLITDDDLSSPKYVTGSVGGNGGVIKWLGDNGCLINATFVSNRYSGLEPSGRVISWEGKNGTIIESYFKLNSIRYLYYWHENTTGSSIINRYLYGDYDGDLFGDNLYVRNASVNVLDNPVVKDINCYYGADKVYYELSTDEGIIFSNQNITVSIYAKDYNKTFNCTSDSKGRIALNLSGLPVGKYKFICNCTSVSYIYKNNTLIFNSTLTVEKAPVKFVCSSYKTMYDSGKKFDVKVLNSKDNSSISGIKVSLKVYTGKSYKTLNATTNSKGIASFSLSKNTVGTHKIIISANGNVVSAKKNSSIKINKANTNVKLSKTSFKYKKSNNLKISLTNKNTKKPIPKVTLKIKVYTGKSYKTYSLKTDKNGMVKINTKGLKKGNHKIVISSSSKYYTISRTATIKVK